jgi:hypothetical protein
LRLVVTSTVRRIFCRSIARKTGRGDRCSAFAIDKECAGGLDMSLPFSAI